MVPEILQISVEMKGVFWLFYKKIRIIRFALFVTISCNLISKMAETVSIACNAPSPPTLLLTELNQSKEFLSSRFDSC